MALDLLLHDLVLHHIMQFRNFYLVFLSVSQCQGIAPCYTTLELIRDAIKKKNTSYSVTLSLKVGGGQDEIILLGDAKILEQITILF